MTNPARMGIIRRLRILGSEVGHGRFRIDAGGGRTVWVQVAADYVNLDRSFVCYHRASGFSGKTLTNFSTVEELDVALVYITLVDRRKAWPMTWFVPDASPLGGGDGTDE